MLVSDIDDLPSLPEVLLRIYDLLETPAGSTTAISRVLGVDVALSAQTLRWANSPLFSRGDITDLNRAVQLIGPYELILLLTSQQVVSIFPKLDSRKLDMKKFWRRSLYAACSVRVFAKDNQEGNPDLFFIAAFLADIGTLLVAWHYPERFDELCPHSASLGIALLEAWNTPDVIVKTITEPSALFLEAIGLGNIVFDNDLANVSQRSESHIDRMYTEMRALIKL